MAKKTINLGTGELTGDGESIRSAFDKINDNFDELYAVEHDLSAIDQSLIPDTDVAYDLGSTTNRFRDLYLSGSTIDLGGTTLSVVDGNLQIGGTDIKDVVTNAGVDYSEIQNTPNLSNYIQQGDRLDGDLEGSLFADDSTLLVDGVNSKINLQNTVLNDTISTSDENFFINTAATPGDRGFTNITTTDSILDIQGAAALPGGQGGGIYINGGIPFDDPSDYTRYGDIIISGRIVSILAGDGEGGGGVTFAGPVIGTTAMDIKGSVFGDDSTVLVDGVSGTIPASVVSGTITNAILTDSLETITDIRFGTYADARKPKISIAGIGENNIAITAGYDINTDDSGNVSIDANTDGTTPGRVNIATSSGDLLLGKSGGEIDVFSNVEFHGRISFQDGDGVDFNGPVDFSDANVQNFAPGSIYANSGQYLYVVGKHAGGSATNVAFTYDTNINNARQIFYGKTEFANNGQAAIVDFTGATFTGEPWISVADLKTLVAASTDFEDFQTRIAAL